MLCKGGLCRHVVSVRPSIWLSVTLYSVETNKQIKFFRTKRYGNIPTVIP